MKSVPKALESGADIFEIDVHFDQNQYPILSHNAPPV
jgi:glycerophosphoryl diester phosphodiesterase